jgi:hypothetical protein
MAAYNNIQRTLIRAQNFYRVLMWFRAFLPLGQERSTKTHEAARTELVPLRVFSWIVFTWQGNLTKQDTTDLEGRMQSETEGANLLA